MATKSGQPEPEKAEVVEELLEALDASLDRVKVLYEQYFLGIQKQPPTYLHTDVERKIRDLVQLQIRNTALRYRFATLQQKFGSYNAYWRRTLRQIENGTYTRNLSKIGRHAAKTGAAVPEEILAAMPKRMRDQVKRDREAALALAELRSKHADEPEFLTLVDDDEDLDLGLDDQGPSAFIRESAELRRSVVAAGGTHKIDESDADFDLDAFFAKVTSEGEPSPEPPVAAPSADAAPAAQSGALLDPPAIRWHAPAPKLEPRPSLEMRPGAQVAGDPAPGLAPRSPSAAGPDDIRLPATGRPGSEPTSTGQPSAGRAITIKPNPAPPTVRLRSPSLGRPITANPSGEGPDTERLIAKRPSTEPPSATPPSATPPSATPPSATLPSSSAGQPVTQSLSTRPPSAILPSSSAGQPVTQSLSTRPPSATPPSAILPSSSAGQPPTETPSTRPPDTSLPNTARTITGPLNTGAPTVRLRNPGFGRPITEPPSAAPPSAALPSAAPPSAAPPSAVLPSAAPPSAAPPSAAPPSAAPLSFRSPSSAPPTVRLRSPGAGRMATVRGIEQPTSVEEQEAAEQPSTAKPSTEQPRIGEGQPPAAPPSAGAGQPGPPIGIRPIVPSMLPPVRGASMPAPARASSPLPTQLITPNPPKPPTPAPSQATRPLPIVPGAAAALAPSTAETLAGPFPRIPSPPAFPNKPRAASEAPPAAEERAASTERTPPAQAPDRAAPSRPAPTKP